MIKTTAIDTRPRYEALHTDGMGSDELRGRAVGVIVGAVMGLTWVGVARDGLSSVAASLVLVAGVAVCAMLIVGALRLRRAAAAGGLAAPTPPGAGREKVQRRFWLVTLGEGAAIAATVSVLGRSGRSEWIPAAICAVVGLHFIPLARLFDVPLYYATAAGLCLVAAITMILGATGAAALWRPLPGLGAALTLWATSLGLLLTTHTGPPVRR
ncbi:MAG: hypothetical protein QOD57_5288 [Actinomycetota bacterium]|jgi:hypothetical protein|nr:hypothetical protein [Actinomycetota bacterium]